MGVGVSEPNRTVKARFGARGSAEYTSLMFRRLLLFAVATAGCQQGVDPNAAPADTAAEESELEFETNWEVATPIGTPTGCATSAECGGGQICAFYVGDCKGKGVCVARGKSDGGFVVHCGCDGHEVDTGSEFPKGYSAVPTRGPGVCPGDGGTDAPVCDRLPGAGCPTKPCPTGTKCAMEIGGPRGGGDTWCVPIPSRCAATPTCACMGLCACGVSFNRPEACVDVADGSRFWCDDGIR